MSDLKFTAGWDNTQLLRGLNQMRDQVGRVSGGITESFGKAGKALLGGAAVLTAFRAGTAALKSYGEVNAGVAEDLDRLNAAATSLSNTVARLLAPFLDAAADSLSLLADGLKAAEDGFIALGKAVGGPLEGLAMQIEANRENERLNKQLEQLRKTHAENQAKRDADRARAQEFLNGLLEKQVELARELDADAASLEDLTLRSQGRDFEADLAAVNRQYDELLKKARAIDDVPLMRRVEAQRDQALDLAINAQLDEDVADARQREEDQRRRLLDLRREELNQAAEVLRATGRETEAKRLLFDLEFANRQAAIDGSDLDAATRADLTRNLAEQYRALLQAQQQQPQAAARTTLLPLALADPQLVASRLGLGRGEDRTAQAAQRTAQNTGTLVDAVRRVERLLSEGLSGVGALQ